MPNKSVKTLVSNIIKFLLIDRKDIKLIVVYGIASSLLNLALPLGVQSIFSVINYKTALQPVIIISLIVFVGLGMSATLQSFQVYLVETVQKKIFSRITLSIGEFLPKVKLSAFDQINGKELMNRFFEVLHVQKMQALILMDGLAIFLQITLGLCLLAFYHPYLLAYDILLIVALYFIIFRFGSQGIQTSIIESKQKYKVAAWLEEIADNQSLFNLNRGVSFTSKKIDHLVHDYIVKRHSHFKILFKQYIGTYVLFVVSSVGILALGGWLVISGELSIGQLVAAEIIISGIVISFTKIGKYLEAGYDLAASFEKLETIFNLPLKNEQTLTFSKDSFEIIEGKNIVYDYPNGHQKIGPFNFNIPMGSKVAFSGPSGVGKTTLSEMLTGCRPPTSGQITIDDINIFRIDENDRSRLMGYLSKAQTFPGTLIENISLEFSGEASAKTVDLLKNYSFAKYLLSNNQILETPLQGHNGELSDTMAVIISLLRVLYSLPKILVIDQTLDSLDIKLQKEILSELTQKHPEMTLVVFTNNENIAKILNITINLEATS